MTAAGTSGQGAGARPTPRALVGLLLMAALVGVFVSLGAWAFLEVIHGIQTWVFSTLPKDLGYDNGAPAWLYILALAIAGLLTAFAIVRLRGEGGHVPAEGLKVGGPPITPPDLPGITLAALASIGLGAVVGPEAPLIALGAGLGLLALNALNREVPDQAKVVIAGSGSFAAVAMIFGSPIIAAVILLEALGLDREKLPLFLLPGLLAAGIGSLISIGMGSITGLSTSAYALGALTLPTLARPVVADFLWTIPLGIVVAAVTFVAKEIGLRSHTIVMRRALVLIPAAGIVIAGLALAFHAATGKDASEVLFSGQDALPGLVSGASTWSISALLLLIGFKGIAWGISLGSFRGGPTFPAMFIGAAAGIIASHLPGFSLTAAVGVGIGTGVVSMLRLPLSAVVIATLLVSHSGPGSDPLIIVGVVIAYVTSVGLDKRFGTEAPAAPAVASTAAPGPAATSA